MIILELTVFIMPVYNSKVLSIGFLALTHMFTTRFCKNLLVHYVLTLHFRRRKYFMASLKSMRSFVLHLFSHFIYINSKKALIF